MEFSYVPIILIILVVAEEHSTYFNSEKGRSTIFMLFIQQTRVEMQARKLTTYHGLHFDSFQPHGSPIGCKIAKTGEVLNEIGRWRSGTFSTGIYGGRVHFDLANHTAKAHKIYWKFCIFRNSWQIQHKSNLFSDNGAPFNTFR
jgi:hypothetical protein